MKAFLVVLVAFFAAAYGVKTERIEAEAVQDQSKLNFSCSDKRLFRIFVHQLGRWRSNTQELIKPKLPQNASSSDTLDSLDFSADLTDSTFNRTTNAGVLTDDMQRFHRFHEAVELVTSTSSDVKVQDASRKLEKVLFSLTGLMRHVMRKNSISVPPPQDLSGLKGKLDKKTKDFLEFFGENDTQIMAGGQVRQSVLNNVRNYVILRDLAESMVFFIIDFGKLIE